MADQYSLNLKAILDTSDVQLQLQLIQGQLNKSGVIGGGVKQQVGSATTNALNNNAANINNSLQRLNITLNNLNAAINRLINITAQDTGKNIPVQTNAKSLIASPSGIKRLDSTNKLKFENFLKQNNLFKTAATDTDIYNYLSLIKSSATFKTAQDNLKARFGDSWDTASQHLISAKESFKTKMGGYGTFTSQEQYAEYVNSRNFEKDIKLLKKALMDPGMQKRFLKGISIMLAGLLASSAQQFADTILPNGPASNILGGISTIASSTAAGAMFGGPVGAAIGGAVGTAQTAIEYFTKSIERATASAKEFSERLISAKKFESTQSDIINSRVLRDAKKYEDKQVIKGLNQKYEAEKKNIGLEVKIFEERGSLVSQERQLRQLELQREDLSKYNPLDIPDVTKLDAEINAKKASIDAYKRNTERLNQIAEFQNEYKESLKEIAIAQKKRAAQISEMEFEDKLFSGTDKYASKQRDKTRQTFYDAREKLLLAKKSGDITAIEAAQIEYDSARNKYNAAQAERAERRGINNQANSILSFYGQRTILDKFEKKYNDMEFERSSGFQLNELTTDLTTQRNLRYSFERQAQELAEEAKSQTLTTDQRKEKLEAAAVAEKKARNFDLSISLLENRILKLDFNMQRPDMSVVQSLGQYGFNMGEKNDNQQRIMDFWRDSLSIQRRIRDILNDKSFNATYEGDTTEV